jgi:peroxiredoxin
MWRAVPTLRPAVPLEALICHNIAAKSTAGGPPQLLWPLEFNFPARDDTRVRKPESVPRIREEPIMSRAFGLLSIAMAAAIVCAMQFAQAAAPDASNKGEAAEEKGLKIGDRAPAWEKLAGTDDKEHSLSDLKKSKAIAVIFTCNTCPVAVAYEDRLIKLANDYKDKGVAVVAINVNADERNNLEAMKQRAEKKGFTFDYIIDPSQEIGRKYGATVTPHVFLLDSERKIAYMGAIDDDMKADNVKQHSLQDAIDAVLAGHTPAVAETKQFGCGIRYE